MAKETKVSGRYEKVIDDRGGLSLTRRARWKNFDRLWIEAGCPRNFCLSWREGVGITRVWDPAARREKLEDIRNPEAAAIRKQQGELRIRAKKKQPKR
jgi:hypothetical protein